MRRLISTCMLKQVHMQKISDMVLCINQRSTKTDQISLCSCPHFVPWDLLNNTIHLPQYRKEDVNLQKLKLQQVSIKDKIKFV